MGAKKDLGGILWKRARGGALAGQWERSRESCRLTCADAQGEDRKYSVRYSVRSVLTELRPLCVAGVQHLAVLTVILAFRDTNSSVSACEINCAVFGVHEGLRCSRPSCPTDASVCSGHIHSLEG